MPTDIEPSKCHLCASGTIERLPLYSTLARVTSDCQPWPKGGTLAVCDHCGGVQKVIDAEWLAEIDSIYKNYAIYHQGEGSEQAVFDRESGQASSRSARLLRALIAEFPLQESGRLLDVGCGNGATLRAASAQWPAWSLVGTELDDKYRAVVESIPGVEAQFTCPPDETPGRYDAITMIHVLEHIASPRDFLAGLRAKLAPEGLLVVQVPDHRQNPFELAIADHASHFSVRTLPALVESAGFTVARIAEDWVPKELTVVARPGAPGAGASTARAPDPAWSRDEVSSRLRWLASIVSAARTAAASTSGPFGLFGTSIAATWLTAELGEIVGFFVDEDPNRVGKAHLGRPIYHPGAVPAGARVFLALPPAIAESVRRRLAPEGDYVMPPPVAG